MADDLHDIYAIRYEHHDRKSSGNFIGGDPNDVLQPLDSSDSLDFARAREGLRPWVLPVT
jgi:hypothetical protein